jgi:hypothetical protein
VKFLRGVRDRIERACVEHHRTLAEIARGNDGGLNAVRIVTPVYFSTHPRDEP